MNKYHDIYMKQKLTIKRLQKYCKKHDKTAVFHYFPSGNISCVIGEICRRDKTFEGVINKTIDACEKDRPLTSIDLANAMYKY